MSDAKPDRAPTVPAKAPQRGKGGSHQVVEPTHPAPTAPDWDEVDEASWESFPASDPPAFGPQTVSPPAKPEPERPEQPER